ncbi:MAG: hypothetical protein WBL50_28630, partial [Candidatus Acidiferrum sp.]
GLAYTRFPSVRLKPLGHLSGGVVNLPILAKTKTLRRDEGESRAGNGQVDEGYGDDRRASGICQLGRIK